MPFNYQRPKALVDRADEKQREREWGGGGEILQTLIDAHSSQQAYLQMCR